jgi:hypothetical protein
MIPVKLFWNTRKRSIFIKWNVFFSFGWQEGKPLFKILGFRKSFKFGGKRISTPLRWVDFRETLSFLSKWKLKKVEGTLSLPDPMLNGLLYGWLSAMGQSSPERKIDVTVNFLGENWISGEASISPRISLRYLAGMCLRNARVWWRGRRRGPERGG